MSTVLGLKDSSINELSRNTQETSKIGVTLSIHALLVNPTLRHLAPSQLPSKRKQDTKLREVGKRKARRAENARLADNPHVVIPRLRDYSLQHPNPLRAPAVLPPALKSTNRTAPSGPPVVAPSAATLAADLVSTQEGHFRMSKRQATRFLRRKLGFAAAQEHSSVSHDLGTAQSFVLAAQQQLDAWLSQDVHICQQAPTKRSLIVDSTGQPALVETLRTSHALVWVIPDAFLRLLTHCLARTQGLSSFSKGEAPDRQTWLLRASVTRPGMTLRPPSDYLTATDTSTDTATDTELDSSDAGERWELSSASSELAEHDALQDDVNDVNDATLQPFATMSLIDEASEDDLDWEADLSETDADS